MCETISSGSEETKQNLLTLVDAYIQTAQMSSALLSSDQISQALKVLAAAAAPTVTSSQQSSGGTGITTEGRRLLSANGGQLTQQHVGWLAGLRVLLPSRQGRQLAQSSSTASSSTNAAVQSSVDALAALLAASASPASGFLSSGSNGLYLTVANLLGSMYGGEPLAVGSVLSSAGSNKAASPDAIQNVLVQMLSPLAGICIGESGSTACVDGAVLMMLQYYADPAIVVKLPVTETSNNNVASSSGSGRRLLDSIPSNNSASTQQSTALQDLQLLTGAVVVSVNGAPTAGGSLPCSDRSTAGSSSNSSLADTCEALVTVPLVGTVSSDDSKALVALRVDDTGTPLAPNTTNPDAVLVNLTNSNTTAQVS